MQKVISPIYEVKGKRRKLTGWTAEVDGVALGIVFDSRDDAQAAADDRAYTLLTRSR